MDFRQAQSKARFGGDGLVDDTGQRQVWLCLGQISYGVAVDHSRERDSCVWIERVD